MGKMVWNNTVGKMVDISTKKGERSVERIAIDSKLATALKQYAIEDGYSFTGVSYVTEKTADGKTKHDKDGKPVFIMENGKPKKVAVEASAAKVNSAIADYVAVAVRKLIDQRESQKT